MSRFRVGDKVMIVQYMSVGSIYGGVTFTEDMWRIAGQTTQIAEVVSKGIYRLTALDTRVVSSEMLCSGTYSVAEVFACKENGVCFEHMGTGGEIVIVDNKFHLRGMTEIEQSGLYIKHNHIREQDVVEVCFMGTTIPCIAVSSIEEGDIVYMETPLGDIYGKCVATCEGESDTSANYPLVYFAGNLDLYN